MEMYVFIFENGSISLHIKKQDVGAQSTVEVKYIAIISLLESYCGLKS